MNILMALSQLEVTGAEVYATTLSDRFTDKGHKVFLVSDTLTKTTKGEYHKLEFNKRNIFGRIKQVKFLVNFIKKNDIQIAHAHSRASAWSTAIACNITGIPLVTTIHGRQPVHPSRKLFKGFGDYSFAVCDNIMNHLTSDLGVKQDKIEVLRNGIDTSAYISTKVPTNEKKIISIIGRLSGPKGDVAYNLLKNSLDLNKFNVRIIGGKDVPARFNEFKDKVEFLGYVADIPNKIVESDIIIGAGRVAVEGILSGRPVLAIGESSSIGLITKENISDALASNFGDIGLSLEDGFDWELMKKDVERANNIQSDELDTLRLITKSEFDLINVVDSIEKAYQKQIVLKNKYDIPVLMYHRVIRDVDTESGVHGTYVTETQFDNHMKILKDNNYEVITFADYTDNRFTERFAKDKKQIMITFDDGYVDNYTYAFPILKKYGYNAVIYLVSHLTYNKWDVENPSNPEKKFQMMDRGQIKEMQEYGIEFGGHTKNHVKLSKVDIEEARLEISDSTEILEELLGEKMLSFAYPYGDLNEEVKEITKEAGYEFGVATDSGSVCFSDDLFQIRRVGIFPSITNFGFKRKIKGNYNFIKIKRENK